MQNNPIVEYIKSITEKYKSGQAKEHAYRPALQKLFSDITGLNVINDPKRSEYGAPDFVFMKGKVAAAYAEAKDIGVSLDETDLRYYEKYVISIYVAQFIKIAHHSALLSGMGDSSNKA